MLDAKGDKLTWSCTSERNPKRKKLRYEFDKKFEGDPEGLKQAYSEAATLGQEARVKNKIDRINTAADNLVSMGDDISPNAFVNTLDTPMITYGKGKKPVEFIFSKNKEANEIIKNFLKTELKDIFNGPSQSLHKPGYLLSGKLDETGRSNIVELGTKFGFDMTKRFTRLRFDGAIKNFLKAEGLDKGNTFKFKKPRKQDYFSAKELAAAQKNFREEMSYYRKAQKLISEANKLFGLKGWESIQVDHIENIAKQRTLGLTQDKKFLHLVIYNHYQPEIMLFIKEFFWNLPNGGFNRILKNHRKLKIRI